MQRSLRADMPTVAAFVDVLREVFGVEVVDDWLRGKETAPGSAHGKTDDAGARLAEPASDARGKSGAYRRSRVPAADEQLVAMEALGAPFARRLAVSGLQPFAAAAARRERDADPRGRSAGNRRRDTEAHGAASARRGGLVFARRDDQPEAQDARLPS